MSFYTSLTGLNAATAQLSVTSNNIANVATTGFKRSRADFGDIFATSPLQKASSVIGQGVALKQVSQEFSQGNIQFSANSLDIAITGDGFFPLKSADGLQDIYTRNGTFMLNDSYNVVNSAGQALIAAAVDSSGKADLENLSKLLIPRKTTGDAIATSEVQLGLNLPADAKVPTLPFDRNDDTTYNKTTAVTVYDAGGNGYLATVYYRKTQVATPEDPTNKWQTYVYIGDTKLQEMLIQSSDKKTGEKQYVNKYGEVRAESQIPPQDIARGVTKLFNLDDLKNPILSTPATVKSGNLSPNLVGEWKAGIEFPAKVNALVAGNPTQGAVFKAPVNAAGFSLATRKVQEPVDNGVTKITTKVQYTPTAGSGDFSLTIGAANEAGAVGTPSTYIGTSLDELAKNINTANPALFEASVANGKLTVQVKGTTVAIDTTTPPQLQSSVSTTAVPFDPTLTEKLLEANFEPIEGAKSFYLKIGNDTYTGDTAEDVKDAIEAGGKFAAEVNGGTLTIKLRRDPTTNEVLAGKPTEIAADYKFTAIETEPRTAGSLAEMAELINADTGIDYTASLNAQGDLVLLPGDSAVAVDGKVSLPEFSMIASFNGSGTYLQALSQTTSAISFSVPYLSGDLTLDLDGTTYPSSAAESIDDLAAAINTENGLIDPTDPNDPNKSAQKYIATVTQQADGSKTLKVTIANPTTSTLKIPANTSLTARTVGVDDNPEGIVFDIKVDGSTDPVTVDLSYLSTLAATKKFTGVEIAREITNAINKAYGDEKYFDFTSFKAAEGDISAPIFRLKVGDQERTISLAENRFGIGDLSKVKLEDAIKALQAQIDKETGFPASVKVGYDPVRQSFTFKASDDAQVSIRSAGTARNELFGLTNVETLVDASTGTWGKAVLPNGSSILNESERRFGIEVKFDEANNVFTISSGTTGDTSSIEISRASAMANALFGLQRYEEPAEVETSATPLRGITSEPAVLNGNNIGLNLDNKFRVDGSNNQFVVTVDNVTGLITMPEKADYTMEEFRVELERRINSLADNFGRTVSGVTVDINTMPGTNKKFFTFTTGTTGDSSFLKVSANSIWGLSDLPSARGTTSKWIEPPQAKNANGFPLYVDRDGMETSDPGTFSEDETRDLWSPIFLDKGELTFDTAGKLFSPLEAIAFKSTTIGASGATLQFSIDYASSTQYSSPFSVLKQDQNGRPEGDLIGVDIGDDGLVSASYSNGTQKSLAKIVLVNFAAPTGLRQIGDASYYATSKSGDAKYGEAGSAGFGTVRAGARERANVDLTNELIELITAQRNFQANAKAIETNNTLTQAIINIRS